MENFGRFCLSTIIMILIIFIDGFTGMLLWNWLIVPVFHLTILTLIQSIGLMTFIGFLKIEYKKEDKESKSGLDLLLYMLMLRLILGVILIFMAYIINLYL